MKTESKKKVEDYDKKIRETNIKKNKKKTTNNLTIHTSSNLNNIGDNNKMTTNKFTTNTMNSNKGEMKTENSLAKRMNYQVPPPQRKAKTEEVETNNEDEENNQIQTEKLKEECVTKLLNNAQKMCIEKAKIDIQNEQKGKEYQMLEKRVKTLEQNGEQVGDLEEGSEEEEEENEHHEEGEEENIETNEHNEEEQENNNIENQPETEENIPKDTEKNDTSIVDNKSKKTSKNTSKVSYYNTSKQSYSVDNKKKVLKQPVDSLSFMNEINAKREIRNEIQDSFRRSASSINRTTPNKQTSTKAVKVDRCTQFIYDNEGNYQYTTKHPLPEEIKKRGYEHKQRQRQRRLEEEQKREEEKKQKAIKKYINLTQLNEKTAVIRQNTASRHRTGKNYVPNEYCNSHSSHRRSSSESTVINAEDLVKNMQETNQIIRSGSSGLSYTHQNETEQMGKEEYDKFLSEEEEEAKNGKIDISVINKDSFHRSIKKVSSHSKEDNSSGLLDEKIASKVQNTLKKAAELQASENLKIMLGQSLNKSTNKDKEENKSILEKSASVHSVHSRISESRYEEKEHDEEEMIPHDENIQTEPIETNENQQQPSIQVPSTIQQSNLVSINQENKKDNSISDDIIVQDNKSEKEMSQKEEEHEEEEIEVEEEHSEITDYENKFEMFSHMIEEIQMKRFYSYYITLRDYIYTKARYTEGIRQMVSVIKFYPFSQMMNNYNYEQYNTVFKAMTAPFMRNAFADFINGLAEKAKLFEFCNILTRLIKFQLLKNLSFYNECKDIMALTQLVNIYEEKQTEQVEECFNKLRQYANEPSIESVKPLSHPEMEIYPKSQNESFLSNKENDLSNNTNSIDSFRMVNQTDIGKPKVSLKQLLNERPGKAIFRKLNKDFVKRKLSSSKTISKQGSFNSPFDQDISADKDRINIEWEDSMQNKSSNSNREALKFDKQLTPTNKKDLRFDEKIKEEDSSSKTNKSKSEDEIIDVKIERTSDDKKKNDSIDDKYDEDFDNIDEELDDEHNNDELVKQIQNEANNANSNEKVSLRSRNNSAQKDSDLNENEIKEDPIIMESPKENKESIPSGRSDEIIITDKNESDSKIFMLSDTQSQVTDLNSKANEPESTQEIQPPTSFIKNSTSMSTSTKLGNNRYGEEPEQVEKKPLIEKEEVQIKEEIPPKEEVKQILPISQKSMEELAEEISNELIQSLLNSEIKKEDISLIHKKNNKSTLDNSGLQISQQSNSASNNSPRGSLINKDSMYSDGTNSSFSNNDLNNSIFMRTVGEIRKEVTLNLYNEKIAPKFIETITKEIDNNFPKIVDNLSHPYKFDGEDVMNKIMLNDKEFLNKVKGRFTNQNSINNNNFVSTTIVDKFKPVAKDLRNSDNVASDGYYDNILNECLVDATNEIISKERLYGNVGEPLPWSDRTREVGFKYQNNEVSKKKMEMKVSQKLNELLKFKMGLIYQNHDYLDSEQLNQDRETKFIKSIKEELEDDEENWKVFETEETLIKLILSKIIMGQLLNEVVEILEHVQLSRRDPSKYQSKSIYACEDIPRLSIQNTTENITNTNEDNDNINQ